MTTKKQIIETIQNEYEDWLYVYFLAVEKYWESFSSEDSCTCDRLWSRVCTLATLMTDLEIKRKPKRHVRDGIVYTLSEYGEMIRGNCK